MPTSTLETVRSTFSGPFVALLWLMAGLACATGFLEAHRLWLPIALLSIGAASVGTAFWRRSPTGDATRWATSVAAMMQVALLVLAAEGTEYQTDLHMAFFAMLAITACWCCPVSLVLGTAFVAVQHLSLNFIYPLAIFPYGSSLAHVALHAVILVAAAAALVLLSIRIIAAMNRADASAEAATDALAVKAKAELEREAMSGMVADTRRETEDVVLATMGGIVAAARAGDFSARPSATAELGRLGALVDGFSEINVLVDTATQDILQGLNALAQGDLTRSVTSDYHGRFGELKDALNETIERLSETVGTIQTTAEDVSSAAREIASGANDLSQRTEQQASSLEETAATTEELAASVKASAQSSRQAVDLADQAMTVASDGGGIVRDAVEAMARIEQASQKISDITSVIDEIAFQTNLLALNAAVEAARAGDAGKGFAVVASEVRTLAQRSSEAAKDITGLISASGAEVSQGVRLVRAAGEALEKIVTASQKVSSTVGEISAASGEQANGIDEMSQAVAHMDEMTQQNAALAEESAASAGSLTTQIQRLEELVSTFRTRGGRQQRQEARAPEPRVEPRRPAPAHRPQPAAAKQAASTTEPDRLRKLAAEAFTGRTPSAPASRPAPAKAPARAAAPARRAASGGSDGGWEEL